MKLEFCDFFKKKFSHKTHLDVYIFFFFLHLSEGEITPSYGLIDMVSKKICEH